VAAQHEQQKCEADRRQTTAINELMDETNSKLSKMQADYDDLLQSTVMTSVDSVVVVTVVISSSPHHCSHKHYH